MVAELSVALTHNFEHTILVTHGEDMYDYSGNLVNLNVHEEPSLLKKILRQRKIIKQIKANKRKYEVDLSVSHTFMSNLQNIFSSTNDKKICVLHGEFDYKLPGKKASFNFLMKKMYRKADVIVSVSHFIKNDFQKIHGSSQRHVVIYNGVDIQKIRESSRQNINLELPSKFLIYLAQLRPEKNHCRLLLNIASVLKEYNIKLLLVGEGKERQNIEKVIQSENLENNVLLIGNLENPFTLLKSAYASIIASETESFSLAAVESLSLGVPIISSDCGGPREIVGVTAEQKISYPFIADCGILIPHVNSWNNTTFADEILMLWNNEELRNEMAKNAEKRAQYFSIEKTQSEYVQLIHKTIKSF